MNELVIDLVLLVTDVVVLGQSQDNFVLVEDTNIVARM